MNIGRTLILIGLILVAAGFLFLVAGKLPLKLGRLPGDIIIRGKNSVFYFPLTTSILISIVGSFILWLITRR